MNVAGNTILITGGTSGIGLALVNEFYQLGNKILVVARNRNHLADLKKRLPEIITYACDLTRQTDIEGLVDFVERDVNDLNLVINNAAIQYTYNFLTEKDIAAKVDYEVSANLLATLKLCGLLLPVVSRHPHAAIVNVSSGLALAPKKSAPVYCATKAAVQSF